MLLTASWKKGSVAEMKKIMIIILVVVSGCSWLRPEPIIQTKTIEVKVPVYLKAEAPDFLLKRQKYDLPDFHHPSDVGVSSCLNTAGEEKLKRLLIDLDDRLRAWIAWGE